MSREIKFRAWSNERGMMITQGEKYTDGLVGEVPNSTLADFFDNLLSDYTILMQLTGLKDKNGKEIFEGDVLKVVAINVAVVWNFGKASWFTEYGSYKETLTAWKASQYEVIGNVWENPELLKAKL